MQKRLACSCFLMRPLFYCDKTKSFIMVETKSIKVVEAIGF